MITAFILLVFHWFLALFCQSFFLHRYASHGMFEMNRFWERFFYFLTFVAQGPSFLNPRCYSIMHQRHHRYSDGAKDPHAPSNYASVWSMMLDTYRTYKRLLNNSRAADEKGIVQYYPDWPLLENIGRSWLTAVFWPLIYMIVYFLLEIPWYGYSLIFVHSFVGPIQGAIVNWCGHRYGHAYYENGDHSKNTLLVDIPLMGELYQNNHHYSARRMNFAHRWYELDITYQLARLLKLLGVIYFSEDTKDLPRGNLQT